MRFIFGSLIYENESARTINMSESAQQPSLLSRAKAAFLILSATQWENKIQNFVRDAGLEEVDQSTSTLLTEKSKHFHHNYFMILDGREARKSLVYLGKKDGAAALTSSYGMCFKYQTDDKKWTEKVELEKVDDKFVYSDNINYRRFTVSNIYKTSRAFKVVRDAWNQPKTTSERVVVAQYSTQNGNDTYVVFDNTPPPTLPIAASTTQNPVATQTESSGGRRKSQRVTQSGKRRRRQGTARPRRRRR